MTAYEPEAWTDFFVAAAGASAALAGLVFVAVSINIDRILNTPGVPTRALETVLALLGVVICSLIMLLPDVSDKVLGALILVIIFGLVGIARHINRQNEPAAPGVEGFSRRALTGTALFPPVIGGISLIVGHGGGIYWIAAGLLLATLAAVMNAWVLLVEILR